MSQTNGMTYKEKIDHYWYYYKWHLFVLVCIIAAIVYTLISCHNIVEPDLDVLLVSDVAVDKEDQQRFIDKYSPYVTDVNGDGKKTITITFAQFSNYATNTLNPQLEMASEELLKANIMAAENQLIIFKNNVTDYLVGFEVFEDLSEYNNEKGYFPIDKDDKMLLDLATSDYSVGVRVQPAKTKEYEKKMYDNAFTVLEQMIK